MFFRHSEKRPLHWWQTSTHHSYPEKYHKTTHWGKIRSAMLLINSAICQAEACHIAGESWYGGNESYFFECHGNFLGSIDEGCIGVNAKSITIAGILPKQEYRRKFTWDY